MLNQDNMQKSKHIIPVLLGLLIMVLMIAMSYLNQSMFPRSHLTVQFYRRGGIVGQSA